MPLNTLLAAAGSAALTIAGLRAIAFVLTYRRRPPEWLRRRLAGLPKGGES